MKKFHLTKNSLISGTLLLTAAGVISRFIGFYYKIFLSRTIGAEGLGIYQLIFPVFSLILAVSASGIHTSVSRFAAGASGSRQAKGYLAAGLLLSVGLSLAGMFLLRSKAEWFCHIMMNDADGARLLHIMSLAIPLSAVHSCINGYYYGLRKAGIPAFSQLFEQFIRVSGVWLIMQIALNQGQIPTPAHAVWGLFIGEAAATLFCLTAMLLTGPAHPSRSAAGHSPDRQNIFFYCKNLLTLAVPLTASRLLSSISGSLEALLIPLSLRAFGYSNSDALSVYGILTGMVFSTIMFPGVISNSLSVMLLPAVSGACALRRNDLIRRAVRKTVESCMILGLVCTLGFLLCGSWIGIHLFHNVLAGVYLKTLAWICPFLFLGSTLGSILHGLGRATATLLISLGASSIRILFIWLGIPALGLKAYLWGMLVSQIFSAGISWLCIHRTGKKRRPADRQNSSSGPDRRTGHAARKGAGP